MSWTPEQFDAFQRERGQAAFKEAEKAAKPSKYRNVRTVVDGISFDSKAEAQHWHLLKMREKAGEIYNLTRQMPFELTCPNQDGTASVVSSYVADFAFNDAAHRFCVQDVKGGKETAMFSLKRKWLFLQTGIEVEVIR